MALAKATVVRRIRRILNDNPWVDICTEAMDTTETDLSVADTTKWDVGAVLEFSDDGERCLVTALASATVLTVIRNYDGASPGTGTSHSINAQVYRDPLFPYDAINDAIDASIHANLWPHVYKLVSATITPVSGTQWYEIDEAASNSTEMLGLSQVAQLDLGSPTGMYLYGERRSEYPVKLHRGVPTSLAGSGVAIYIPRLRNATNSITVRGIGRVTNTLSSTDYADLTDGVQAEAVIYFAVARLVAATDIARTTQEDINMTDETVVSGRRTSVGAYWFEKAVQARRAWEQDLAISLPRKWDRAGDGGNYAHSFWR